MRKLFYWAFAFSLCVLMGCKDDGVRVEVDGKKVWLGRKMVLT